MGKSVLLRAFAKANASLNITGRRGGLHELDSVMVSLDAFDTVKVSERGDKKICVRFTNADIGENNTAYKAAHAVQELIGCNGFDIEIEKGIPMGAGLGGSSADGAAVLRALDLFYRLPTRGVDMQAVALSVGSDVPFMLTGGLARIRGCGEDTFFMENKLKLFAVGLMSGEVSTTEAYKRFDELYPSGKYCPTNNDKLCDHIMSGDGNAAVGLIANALTEPAQALCPGVRKNAELLSSYGAVSCLTGSGGMVLGWFTDLEKFALCAAALKSESGFRVFTTTKTGVLHEWIER